MLSLYFLGGHSTETLTLVVIYIVVFMLFCHGDWGWDNDRLVVKPQ